jgi:hypothetical protein
MTKKKILMLAFAAFFITVFSNAQIQAQTTSVFTAGLKFPQKIIYAPQKGYFLVSEAGAPTISNNGRISIVTTAGARFTLLDGLPSGPATPGGDPSGPSALWIEGNKLYIAIGGGNEVINGPAPGSEIPNPNPNSPLFSSVLEYTFPAFDFPLNRDRDDVLTREDHFRLANGETVVLGRVGLLGASFLPKPTLRVIANFPDFTPSFRPDVPNNVRPSNPFGLVLHSNTLYVADASQNNIRTVDLDDGSIGTLITYPPRVNPLPFGPPVIDAVPDSLRLVGNKLLVTFLTGFPFPSGQADVRQFDLDTNTDSQLIAGLTTAIDVLPVNNSGNSFYTLEFSTNMLMGAPGRLQRFDLPNAPTVISNTLVSPTSMAKHPANGNLLVTEIFTGRIMRISIP